MTDALATVLVVDDAPDVRLLARAVLSRNRFEVLEASGGRQALALLRAGDRAVDLVLLDVQMPDLDGWDTLTAIRRDPALSELAVVLCTVKAHMRDVRRAWELGCDGYLTKPFTITELTDGVRTALARTSEDRVAYRKAMLEEQAQEAAT